MRTSLEISLKYAKKGIDAIRDLFPGLQRLNDSIEITSTNTVEYEVFKDDEEYVEIDLILDIILLDAGIPRDEYTFKEEDPLYLFR